MNATPSVPEIRGATPADLDWMTDVMGRAFHDDPVWRHVIRRHDDTFCARAGKVMRAAARVHLDDGETLVTAERTSVAVWAPPGHWKLPTRAMLRDLPGIIAAVGPTRIGQLSTIAAMEKHHPRDPHYYLAILATAPEHQGKGHGGALLRPVCAKADEQEVGCYLESSKESNVAFYNRFGFEVTGTMQVAGGGPTIYFMWRDPRPPEV